MFKPGDRVRLKGSPSRMGFVISEGREFDGTIHFAILFPPDQVPIQYPEDGVEAAPLVPEVADLIKARQFATASEFAMFLTLKKLEKPLSDNLYTFYSSRTEFQVHQFKPVLKFNSSVDKRLLIADEVGLGKTIEAAIIFTELEARIDRLDRALIVCPAALTRKWKEEFATRFNVDLEIMGRSEFVEFLELYRERGPSARLRGIASLQMLRNQRLQETMEEVAPTFDLVIIDEAHHFRNPATWTSDLGHLLSEQAEALLLLTATPLQLHSYDLYNLFNILLPEQFDNFELFGKLIEPNQFINDARRALRRPSEALELLRMVEATEVGSRFTRNPYYRETIARLSDPRPLERAEAVRLQQNLVELNTLSHVFTRTRKRDVVDGQRFPLREARVVNVKFTPEESELYDAATAYVHEAFALYGSAQGISFAKIMPQRQASSCIPAMKAYATDMMGTGRWPRLLDWEGEDLGGAADEGDATTLTLRAPRRLLQAVQAVGGTDSKFDSFLEAIRNLESEFARAKSKQPLKILVFSFFKRTLEHLNRALQASGYRGQVFMIHGDVAPKIRDQEIARCRDAKQTAMLLSSEVGSEGLDLQFCNVMFNYDLPWNPMRVEQRIGRLDRLGQQSEKILIYNFAIQGTIDEMILSRLYERIGIFERYIGDLDAILGEEVATLSRDMFNPALTSEQKAQRVEEVAEAIERKILMFEEFEQESIEFLGQDDYFTEEVSAIRRTGRFISSHEVRLFVEAFLRKVATGSALRPVRSGRQDVYTLRTDDDFIRFVRYYSDGFAGRDEFVRDLEQRDGGLPVTFESEAATRDRSLTFLTIHHPLIKGIQRYAGETDLQLGSVACLSLAEFPARPGDYFFFVFLLEESSLKKSLRLVPILVSAEDRDVVHVVDEASELLVGRLPYADVLVDLPDFTDEDIDECLRIANMRIARLREEEEQSLLSRNNVLIDARIDTKRRAYESKLAMVRATLTRVENSGAPDRIVRLHLGRLRNLEDKMRRDLEDLEAKRDVHVGFSLLAGGVLRVSSERDG